MNENEPPMRRRQITQDFMHASSAQAGFTADGMVRALRMQAVDVEIQLPSRVEGRFRRQMVTQKQLGEVAIYRSFPELVAGERLRARAEQPEADWTIDDIPAEVQEACTKWEQQRNQELIPDLQQAAREALATPAERMTATEPCPACQRLETRYACRVSGWDREVYSYPLMRLRDEAADVIYEVPFDAALYIDEHAAPLVAAARREVGRDGLLTARYEVGVQMDAISAEYVVRATNGRIQPRSATVSAALDESYLRNVRVALADWVEPGVVQKQRMPALPQEALSAPQIIDALQAKAVKAYTERVTDVDYNQLFESVRQKLGAKGLVLAFGWQYQGMGESEANYQILTPDYRRVGGWSDMDPFEALTVLAKKIDTPVTRPLRPRDV